MIRKLLVLIILSFLILGTVEPVLAAGGSDSDSSGGGSSSGNGGGSSDSGSSSGNAGSSSGGGSESPGLGSGVKIQTGPGVTNEPSGVSNQEQSRDRAPVISETSEVPTQEQSRLQIQDQTEYLQQVHDRQAQLLQDRQLSQDQLNRDVALYSITIVGNVTGMNATQFVQLVEQVKQSYSVTDQARTRIQEQSLITRFFLGGDAAAAQMLLQTTEKNQERIRLMEQDLQNCDCNQTIRDQLQDQLMTLTQDQDQLQALANQTLQDRGIFGGFFR